MTARRSSPLKPARFSGCTHDQDDQVFPLNKNSYFLGIFTSYTFRDQVIILKDTYQLFGKSLCFKGISCFKSLGTSLLPMAAPLFFFRSIFGKFFLTYSLAILCFVSGTLWSQFSGARSEKPS